MALTPEEFLQQADALAELVVSMDPMFKMVAQVKQGFVEQGIGEGAADVMAAEWYRAVFLPVAMQGAPS